MRRTLRALSRTPLILLAEERGTRWTEKITPEASSVTGNVRRSSACFGSAIMSLDAHAAQRSQQETLHHFQ